MKHVPKKNKNVCEVCIARIDPAAKLQIKKVKKPLIKSRQLAVADDVNNLITSKF